MIVIGWFFLVTCNLLKGKQGRRARHFFYAEEIERQKIRAAEYAEEKGEDYLIVRVTEHIFANPTAPAANRTGLYILINKHNLKDKKLHRRTFFREGEMEKQRELARTFAAQNMDDFLIVEVLLEVSASAAAKKRAARIRLE